MARNNLNRRQAITTRLSKILAWCARLFGPRCTYAYYRWWAKQCTLHPNWCAQYELGSDWYDALFRLSKEYNKPYSQSHYLPLWREIARRLKERQYTRVLDIGCGPGQMAAMLLDAGIQSYIGLDFSKEAIEIARRRVPQATFIVGDARTSDVYERAQYDVIVCTEVLEHIDDDLAVLSRFPPGTPCLCTVPDFLCESHVRAFGSVEEVALRYGTFFARFSVDAIPITANFYFLIEGIRNSYTFRSDRIRNHF